MPPYYRRRYYRRNYWNWKRRRNAFRRRRFRGPFQRKYKRRRVRKQKFSKTFKKKLKTLRVTEWQPSYIRKCRISGILELFEAGHGHFGNNFVLYKETYTPHNTPGGGGWSIQEITLSNLFTQNQYFMNYWSVTNSGLNLVRYNGAKIKLYRQKTVDYIFQYYTEEAIHAGKYWYPAFHPIKMILTKNKITVPSLQTQPNNKKLYKKVRLRPPKLLKNNWYFQKHICTFPLIRFATTAVDLNYMFISPKSNNSNLTIHMLNTGLFLKHNFQYAAPDAGYFPKAQTYLYGLENGHPNIKDEKRRNTIYLGGQKNQRGDPIETLQWTTYKDKSLWGNIFNVDYFDFQRTTFIHSEPPSTFYSPTNIDKKVGDTGSMQTKQTPYYLDVRYNPYKDKGTGNIAYWLQVSDATNESWEPYPDPDLRIEGYPFWLMLWGWADYTKKLGKARDLDNNWILVLKSSSSFSTPLAPYVPLSESFVRGQAPWGNDADEILPNDYNHWFPKWKFQEEAIDTILMSGPGTCKAPGVNSIQAKMKYQFFFKWGGNSSRLETITDPLAQPITPHPDNQLLSNEIIDPEQSIENLLYKWDVRRDTITKAAEKRIKEIETHEQSLFTDGIQTQQETTQEKTTQEEEKQALLFQLQQLQQYNQELQRKFLRLRQLTMEQ
nr:MAG: ORF1 [TTV-like mini virus]